MSKSALMLISVLATACPRCMLRAKQPPASQSGQTTVQSIITVESKHKNDQKPVLKQGDVMTFERHDRLQSHGSSGLAP